METFLLKGVHWPYSLMDSLTELQHWGSCSWGTRDIQGGFRAGTVTSSVGPPVLRGLWVAAWMSEGG